MTFVSDEDVNAYRSNLAHAMKMLNSTAILRLARVLQSAWIDNRQVFLCGNGGSAGNAIHLANDFLYGIGKHNGCGMRVMALPANSSVLTCLANDEGYEKIFSLQLLALAQKHDVLVVFSGSGNSPNVIKALQTARELSVHTTAILGFDGGICLGLCETAIHIPLNDMQVVEDMQLIVGHMLMRILLKAGRNPDLIRIVEK